MGPKKLKALCKLNKFSRQIIVTEYVIFKVTKSV